MAAILLRITPFSQRAEPSPLWWGTFPKRRTRHGTTRISRVRCEKAKRGCASPVLPSPGATARRTRGVLVVRATPTFSPLVRHGGGQRWRPRWRPFAHLAGRSLSPQLSLRREGDRIDEKAQPVLSVEKLLLPSDRNIFDSPAYRPDRIPCSRSGRLMGGGHSKGHSKVR